VNGPAVSGRSLAPAFPGIHAKSANANGAAAGGLACAWLAVLSAGAESQKLGAAAKPALSASATSGAYGLGENICILLGE
jgi:hypothetical protein